MFNFIALCPGISPTHRFRYADHIQTLEGIHIFQFPSSPWNRITVRLSSKKHEIHIVSSRHIMALCVPILIYSCEKLVAKTRSDHACHVIYSVALVMVQYCCRSSRENSLRMLKPKSCNYLDIALHWTKIHWSAETLAWMHQLQSTIAGHDLGVRQASTTCNDVGIGHRQGG